MIVLADRLCFASIGLLALIGIFAAPAGAVTNLTRGADAPPITLNDMGGAELSTAKLRGQVIVLVFGEAYHEKTRQACQELDALLRDPRLREQTITPLLIVTQRVTAEDLKNYAADKLPSSILHDAARSAFGAYQVAVMPSAVVIDRQGKVVHAIAGLSERFSDTITDSLLLAAGKLSPEKFEQSLAGQTAAASEQSIRAERIALLAKQLASRGLDDMAVEKYTEAFKLDPTLLPAHQQLGMLLLRQRRLAEAEKEFRTVLAGNAKSMQATLGLAYVQTLRGGAELNEAERSVRDILAKNPAQSRAHYLLGLILEQKHKPEDAAASFKKAAQLLLERSEQE